MPRCIGITQAGTQCTHQARANQERCRTHQRIAEIAAQAVQAAPAGPVNRCTHLTGARQCDRVSEAGHTVCSRHRLLAERMERRRVFREQVATGLQALNTAFAAGEPNMDWRSVAVRLHARMVAGEITVNHEYDIGYAYAILRDGHAIHGTFITYYNHLADFGVPPAVIVQAAAPRLVNRLARLANDRQNVHTNIVSQQTNRGVEIFLSTAVPHDQMTLQEITRQWCDQFALEDVGLFGRVLVDLNYWFRRADCREPGDWLYRRLLNGFWAYVNERWSPKSSSTEAFLIRNEICKRLWEEAVDGIELCCDGHISRLVSVLVGFDASFMGVQSLGEAIQNRMAAIAAGTGTTEQKIAAAQAAFDEMEVPEEERGAWLEAF